MKYSAAFAWENKLLNGLQMQPVFLSLLSRVNGCGNPFSRLLVIARGFSPAAIRSLLREITDSFAQALRMTSWLVAVNVTGCAVNCRSVIASTERCVAIRYPLPRHCGAGVRWTPLRSRSTNRAGRRDRRKVRGNPSLL